MIIILLIWSNLSGLHFSAFTLALGCLVLVQSSEWSGQDIFTTGIVDLHHNHTLARVLMAGFIVLILQRTSAALMLYFRVRAIYPANNYIKVFFRLAIVFIGFICVLFPNFSGLVSAAFDMAVFLAIFLKLFWGTEHHWQDTLWSLFRFDRRGQMSDRLLRDSSFYVL